MNNISQASGFYIQQEVGMNVSLMAVSTSVEGIEAGAVKLST